MQLWYIELINYCLTFQMCIQTLQLTYFFYFRFFFQQTLQQMNYWIHTKKTRETTAKYCAQTHTHTHVNTVVCVGGEHRPANRTNRNGRCCDKKSFDIDPCSIKNYWLGMETQLVAEFVSKTGASPSDALSCLKTWGWDLKKALVDYNGKFFVELGF